MPGRKGGGQLAGSTEPDAPRGLSRLEDAIRTPLESPISSGQWGQQGIVVGGGMGRRGGSGFNNHR